MPTIEWPDGHTITRPTWDAVLLACAKKRFARGYDIRKDLAKRAFVWSGVSVDPTLPSKALFEALDDAGLLRVI